MLLYRLIFSTTVCSTLIELIFIVSEIELTVVVELALDSRSLATMHKKQQLKNSDSIL